MKAGQNPVAVCPAAYLVKSLLGALLLVLLLCPFAAPAETGRAHLSSDPRVNRARALITDRHFDEALSILRPLAPDHPDQTDVLFLIGLAASRASQQPDIGSDTRDALLDEAIAAYHTILIDRPGLVRVRLELAQALFLQDEDELSQQHFERVLAGRPGAAVALNVRRFLSAIRARKRSSAYFGLSLAPDSNLNSSSGEEVIEIGGLPFRLDDSSDEQSGIGMSIWGGGEYQYPLGKRWRLRAGVDLARREYAERDFDQTFVSAHIGPRWLVAPATEFSLLGNTRRRWLAGQSNSREHGLRFEAEHRLTRRLTSYARVSWHRRSYQQRDGLDGPVTAFSLGGSWLATPTTRINAAFGYGRERPDSLVWHNKNHWLRLGASRALPLGFTAGASGELHRTKYEGNWSPFTDGSPREDRTRIVRLSIFNRAFTLRGFSPQLQLVNERRNSNAQLYGYDRNRLELQFVRQL